MKEAHETEFILNEQTHSDKSQYRSTGGLSEKKYEYELEFDSYKTMKLLHKQVKQASEKADIGLVIDSIEPVVRTTSSSIEARLLVTVCETENRHERENKTLNQYEEN